MISSNIVSMVKFYITSVYKSYYFTLNTDYNSICIYIYFKNDQPMYLQYIRMHYYYIFMLSVTIFLGDIF